MDFLAFLVQTLLQNDQKLIREISTNPLGNSWKNGSFRHNFGTRNARKSIKNSKDSYYSLESKQTLSH